MVSLPNRRWRLFFLHVAVASFIFFPLAGCGSGHDSPPQSDVQSPASNQDRAAPVVHATREAGLARVQRLIAIGNMEEAHRVVQEHLLRYPDDVDAMILAAQAADARGKIQEAVGLLDQAAKRSPEQGRFWRARAAVMLAQAEDWSEATSRLEALVAEAPDFDDARSRLADLLNLRGFRFDANEHVRLLCLRSGVTPEQLRGLIVPARSHVTFAEKPDISNHEEVEKKGPLNVARALFSEGDVREAYEVLQRSELVEQRNPYAYAFYGQVLVESQHFEALEQWLREVGPESQRYPEYWMAVGGWAMRQRQFDAAIRMFAEAVLREPGDPAANDRLVQSLAAAGKTEASERFKQRGAEIESLIQLSKQIDSDPVANVNGMFELAQGLSEIGRSPESLGWNQVAVQLTGASTKAQRALDEARQLVLQIDDATLHKQILCGLKLDEFPLDLSAVASASSPDPGPGHASNQSRSKRNTPVFVNVASQVGLDFQYRNAPVALAEKLRMFQQPGGGVACFDYDLDGRVDLYVGQASAEPPQGRGTEPNLLARNLGDRFVDITQAANGDDRGYTGGVTAGDWNQDGFPDLVVGNMLGNTLLINQGDGTFHIQEGDAVWNEPLYTASLAMADVDGDHLPDIVEVNYLDDPSIYDAIKNGPDGAPVLPAPRHFQPSVDRVFLSGGDGSMSGHVLHDSAGESAANGLGVVVTDIDGIPGNEIYVANDHMANQFWELEKGSDSDKVSWQNTAAVRGLAFGARGVALGSMGIAAADFDDNGRLDLHVTNFQDQWSSHYLQNEGGFFDDLVVAFGLGQPTLKMVGFGTQAFDFDNDSILDLVIGNGHIDGLQPPGIAFEMPTQMFALEGSQFVPLRVMGDPGYWDAGHVSRALALCDWNNDGRLDLVITDLVQPLVLLENRTDVSNHWLQLQLVGTRCERDAIGATIKLQQGSRTVTKVVQAGDGYMAKNQAIVCFGLASEENVGQLEIVWPNGQSQLLSNIAADKRYLVVQGDAPFSLE